MTQNKLSLFVSNESIVPLKSTIGEVRVDFRSSRNECAAIEQEKWMMYDDVVVSFVMFVRVILFGVPVTAISTAVL